MAEQHETENDQVTAVDIRDGKVYLTLAYGRVIGNPLAWYPWLAEATQEQQANVELYILSAYWPDLDDGIDVAEMLRQFQGNKTTSAAAGNNADKPFFQPWQAFETFFQSGHGLG